MACSTCARKQAARIRAARNARRRANRIAKGQKGKGLLSNAAARVRLLGK